MKKVVLLVMTLLLVSAAASLAATQPEFKEFQKILDNRCTKCHTRTRIDEAMAEHRDLNAIQQRMIKQGAELDSREQQVLGIYFRKYDSKKTESKIHRDDPLSEYRSVVKARCTGCHSLDIVENAMRENRQFGSLAQLMIKRGAVLNDRDMKVIQTFWGEPLR